MFISQLNNNINLKPASQAERHTTAAVINRFKAKYYPNAAPQDLQPVIDIANRLAQYVLNNADFTSDLKNIYRNLEIKTQRRDLTTEEKQAKIFSIALKVVHQFQTFNEGGINVRTTVFTNKGFKQAPFIKLFGQNASFKVVKAHNSKDRNGIIFIKSLNQGSFNKTELVYDLEKGEKVMRSLLLNLMSDKDLLNWEFEAAFHKQLIGDNYPGIVNIDDYFIIDNDMGEPIVRSMMMEKCDGDLFDLITKLTLDQQKNIMKQLLTTLCQLHKKSFIHGDLKPTNVLFIKSGMDYITKLADFGALPLARRGKSATGTPEYVTPQAWQKGDRGSENMMKEDCFSLGMIAYELRYGHRKIGAIQDYRMRLLDSNSPFSTNFQDYLEEGIDKYELHANLKSAYPHTNLEGPLLEQYDLDGLDDEGITEIKEKCYNAIIEAEFQESWNQSMNEILNNLKIKNNDPYNQWIAELLNPDSNHRLNTQEALNKLTDLIEKEQTQSASNKIFTTPTD